MGEKILVVGDLILDKYIMGDTHRISPEAPVPVVKVNREFSTLGGAANVALNLAKLECEISLVGGIGEDVSGRQILENIQDAGIMHQLITGAVETTVKTRVLSRNQQMIRIDRESNFLWTAAMYTSLEKYIKSTEFEIIAVSDYQKGFVTKTVLDILKSTGSKLCIDPKGLDWSHYAHAFLVKPNLVELSDIAGVDLHQADEDTIIKVAQEIREKYNIEHLVITRGEKGIVHVWDQGVEIIPTRIVEVYDVSGAGDTALAIIAYELSKGTDLHTCLIKANAASSYVVTKPLTYAISLVEYESLLQ